MRRVKFLEELRQMRFEESYSGYRGGRLSQEEAAEILALRDMESGARSSRQGRRG